MQAAGYPEQVVFEGLFLDIMVWLKDEGIIRFDQLIGDGEGGEMFLDCVISGHGMNLLRRKSAILDGEAAADVIMDTSRDGLAPPSQQAKLGALIGGIIGGFTKSIS